MRIDSGKKCFIRAVTILITLCLIVSLFAGCGNNTANAKYMKINAIELDSRVVATNANYELLWDSEANAVLFKSLKTGKVWSDILYDAYLDGSTSANANSGLLINIVNTKTRVFDTIRSYSEIPENGSIVCKVIENGIRVTYFFDTYEIAIPVDYVLKEESVNVSVNTSQILENGTTYKLLSVSVAPFMCSAANNAEGAYLFVPTGSGAIMNVAETADGTKEYVGEVYGSDVSRQVPRELTDEEAIKLPVFGAVNSDSAIMGIVEQGAGAAEIAAQAGNARLGYSNVYVNLYVRGYDEFLFARQGSNDKTLTTSVAEEISGHTLAVAYYPLYEDDASYVGMAKKYREYLIENGGLTAATEKFSPYSVTLIGGTNVTQSILGIPNKKTVAMTTFKQTEEIVKELSAENGILPTVRLLGFGDKGVSAGSIAGGKKYPSIYGGKKQLKSLQEYCKEQGVHLFFDSDIVFYSKSSLGFSKNLNSATTAIGKRIVHYPVSPIKIQDKSNGYTVVSRLKLQEAGKTALKKALSYNNSAVSLSSLGYSAFSDNADKKYYTKSGIEKDVQDIIKTFNAEGVKTAVASANAYAACVADLLFDTSVTNGQYDVFDEAVPFYQIVFHGYKDMYTEAFNLSSNFDKSLAQAVAYGMGLGFTLIGDYVAASDDLDSYRIYGMVYEDNKKLINSMLCKSGYYEIYSLIADAKIVDYEALSSGVTKTEYNNGITVYVNHTAKEVDSPAGKLKAYKFEMK